MADSAENEGAEVSATVVAIELPDVETRLTWFDDWEDQSQDARELSKRDSDYYHNKQWTIDEVRELEKRGQPVITKNRIARKVNFILGEEIKKRVDPSTKPRTPQHEQDARSATDALRFVEEQAKFDAVRSALIRDVLVAGWGGGLLEVTGEADCGCGPDGQPMQAEIDYKFNLRHIAWDRLIWDPHSRCPDFSDAKWLGIIQWLDLDDAVQLYPEAAEALDSGIASARDTTDSSADAPRQWYDKKRKRCKVVEMYFQFGGDWFRCAFSGKLELEQPERTFLMDEDGRHSVCPLKALRCYVDDDGNAYGVVRQLISPQDEINKRASKALHLLSVRQVIAEKGAIPDPQNFQSELAKPDGFAEVAAGSMQEGRVQISTTSDLAQGQVSLLQQAMMDVDAIGPSSANLPSLPESSSGRAFMARQQAASQELGTIFDQLRRWTKEVFEAFWLGVRQYWTREMWLRVTDDREESGYRFVAINKPTTRGQRLMELTASSPPIPFAKALETAAGRFAPIVASDVMRQHQMMAMQAQQMGQQMPQGPELDKHLAQMAYQHPLMQEQILAGDVAHLLVDIVIDEAPETAVLMQEEFDTLSEIAPTLVQSRPDMAPSIAKMLVKASSLPNKKDLVAELEKGPDPKQVQQQQQAAQLQQAMAQVQLQGAQAGVAVAQSQAQLNQAKAQQASVEAQAKVPQTQADVQQKQATAADKAASARQRQLSMLTPRLPQDPTRGVM